MNKGGHSRNGYRLFGSCLWGAKAQNMALACHQSVAGLTADFYLALAALASLLAMLWEQKGRESLQTHFGGSGERQHTNNKENIVILKGLYIHDLAKNLSGEGKIILLSFIFLLPLKVHPF